MSAGNGFKNIAFGVSSDGVNALLGTAFYPDVQDKPSSTNTLVGLWSKKEYEAYTAITPFGSKYCAVGVVKNSALMVE